MKEPKNMFAAPFSFEGRIRRNGKTWNGSILFQPSESDCKIKRL